LGGEAVDQPLLDHLKERFPEARIVHIYASTEAGALFAVTDGQEGFPASWLERGPDGVSLRIVDGVLEVSSPRAMLGYALEDASPKEWVRTGDLVEVRGDRVHFIGREDSMINVGGAKVLPEEVERVAAEVPGVREAYVFGKRSPILGQIVAMQVVIEGGYDAEDVRTRLGQMLPDRLPAYKVPRIIQFVDGIGATETGKKERKANG
jgi:acyl-CoA synthetase (AMP-forming)/AMP-acid ligase II